MRSTSPGRLSSSQDFSIGRSISLTRSSSVRALLLSTVCASVLKADSTAETVVADNIRGCGGDTEASKAGCGSYDGGRCIDFEAADSVNSRSSSGSTFWNDGCGGATSGTAMSSVSSNTSPSGCGGRTSSSVVCSSRPFSSTSMSSWLLVADGGGAGGGTAATGLAAAGILNGGRSPRGG